ncbi:serine hydrolase domain-containing protein [Serinibacter arcticus]|uniref:Beta-lactamase n=1 Tax=Serinibacter arcticus TaxID=1655435 RepID=A0A4Z1E7V6_9MICO|nr:serine hydrolase domain-containing protein [Serinibacter arcticus]TGO06583.1 beta-lactamase [Serinibacter arcticus]
MAHLIDDLSLGDTDLLGSVRGWRLGDCVVAVVQDGGVVTAGVGADPEQHVEIGSISQALTGLLYEDALERGEVARTTTLGDALPTLVGSPAAGVTLDALATHRSGLPRLAAGTSPRRREWDLVRHGRNPYGETLPQLLRQTVSTSVTATPRVLCSNLGGALLGHAVAARAGTDYAGLLDARLAAPLGLDSVHVADVRGDLLPGTMVGTTRRGRRREAWVGEGIAPAVGVRATVGDVARLAAAILAGEAPGLGALEPRADLDGGTRIGSGWLTSAPGRTGRTVTWLGGGTGGFRSYLGLDRARGRAIVAVSPRSVAPDGPALGWLAG